MSTQTSQHGSFTIARVYDAQPSRVFAASAGVEAKSRWFAGPDAWVEAGREFDFRVGGRECLKGRWKNGRTSTFDARYFDIVHDRCIVSGYDDGGSRERGTAGLLDNLGKALRE